jgi:hypothetical protein
MKEAQKLKESITEFKDISVTKRDNYGLKGRVHHHIGNGDAHPT